MTDDKMTTFTFPIAFNSGFLSAAVSDTGAGAQGFGVTPVSKSQARLYRSDSGYDGSGRFIFLGK